MTTEEQLEELRTTLRETLLPGLVRIQNENETLRQRVGLLEKRLPNVEQFKCDVEHHLQMQADMNFAVGERIGNLSGVVLGQTGELAERVDRLEQGRSEALTGCSTN